MKYSISTIFCIYWLACWITCSNSFVVNAFHSQTSNLGATAEEDDDGGTADAVDGDGDAVKGKNSDRPKNMVDTSTFVTAVDALEGKTERSEGPFAIGKININLSIAGTPGLDLAEAPGPMVLVSGVTGNALEVGIQAGDTIVSIGAAGGTFMEETKGLTLEETATILMSAANHAVENGLTEVELEINRLVKLSYSD